MTKTYENIRFPASFETKAEATASFESPEKLIPQRKQPAQSPRIDLGKTAKATSAKTLAAEFRSSRPSSSGDCSHFHLYELVLYVAILFVFVDV